ncbi:hypothetical protein NEUTE2DRAFT_123497 [Neurospora tetrasperma FGSC 2509]|nr:hypothetical protein NEUTE2DRAFT_123497 [Neurospora tetrasperma FGSC 2509]
MLSPKCPLISTHAFHTSDEDEVLGRNSLRAICRGTRLLLPPVPPPPYSAVQQPQLSPHVHGPPRVYVPDLMGILRHVRLRHPDVSRVELQLEMESMKRWWARSIAPARVQCFGAIHPTYANDFQDFFVDCQIWHKYICPDDSGYTAEELRRRLTALENENRHLSRNIDRLHEEIEGHEQALAEKNAIATAYNEVINGLKEEVKQAEIAKEITEQTMASKVATLEAKLRQVTEESAAQLKAEIAHQCVLAAELKKFKDDSAAEKVKLSNKITNLEAQNEQLLNKKVKDQGQVTTPMLKFASIDETLAKVEAQQSTRVHKIKETEEIEVHDEGETSDEESSGSDKMTYAELELECRRLSDLVNRRNLETGQLHVRSQNLARRTREVEEKGRVLEAKEEGMEKGLVAILTKAKQVSRVGKVVRELVKEGSVPAASDLLASMLEDLRQVVKKFKENVG